MPSAGSIASIGGTVVAVAVPVLIVLVAIAIGVAAGFQTFDYTKVLNELTDLNNQRTAATNTPPDLYAMATDTSGLGLFKIVNTVMSQTLHSNADGTLTDLPSTTTLPAHRIGTDLEFQVGGATPNPLSYKGWNGQIWSAKT